MQANSCKTELVHFFLKEVRNLAISIEIHYRYFVTNPKNLKQDLYIKQMQHFSFLSAPFPHSCTLSLLDLKFPNTSPWNWKLRSPPHLVIWNCGICWKDARIPQTRSVSRPLLRPVKNGHLRLRRFFWYPTWLYSDPVLLRRPLCIDAFQEVPKLKRCKHLPMLG